jgi:CRP-like cAMP-binding protein
MEWALLRPLAEEDRREILRLARRRRFKRGEFLFHEGDPGDTLHLIDRGHVAMRITTPLGDVATLTVEGPGGYFGELALVSESGSPNSTVVALDSVETLGLYRDQFEELRRTQPRFERILVTALADEVRRLSARLAEALYVPVETRVYPGLLRQRTPIRRRFLNKGLLDADETTKESSAGVFAGTILNEGALSVS